VCTQNGIFFWGGGGEGEDVKMLCSNPMVYRMSELVQRPQKKGNKKQSGNLGYMGRSNPWGDLGYMWHVGRYGGRNHVSNIW